MRYSSPHHGPTWWRSIFSLSLVEGTEADILEAVRNYVVEHGIEIFAMPEASDERVIQDEDDEDLDIAPILKWYPISRTSQRIELEAMSIYIELPEDVSRSGSDSSFVFQTRSRRSYSEAPVSQSRQASREAS